MRSRNHTTAGSRLRVCICAVVCTFQAWTAMADDAYFLHPTGTVWGVLMETNASAFSVAACDGGCVVAGVQTTDPGPGIDGWAVLARLDANGGVTALTNFFGEGDQNWASQVIPLYGGDATLDGFAFAGAKYRLDPDPIDPGIEWNVPWMWLVKTDTSLAKQDEALLGAVTHHTEGVALFEETTGFLLGGRNYFTAGMTSSDEWLVRTDPSGVLTDELYLSSGDSYAVHSIAPVPGGGYVLGTSRGIVKVGSDLALVWRTGTESYTDVEPTPDGNYFYGVSGSQLTRLTADGSNDWTRTIGYGGDLGVDLALTPDGGCVVVGTVYSHGHGGGDLWVLKTDAEGTREWDLWLGGEGADYGESVALAEDGNYLVAGSAMVEGVGRMWVLKVRNDLHSPEARFTFDPPSPVFRDQQITFDASASTAPGSFITGYAWEYGDGATNSGVTNRYTYHGAGSYQVDLEVLNADGVVGFTNQTIEITGLEVQWQRFFGNRGTAEALALVETRDGGFMVAGTLAGNNGDLWLIRTDERGGNAVEHTGYTADVSVSERGMDIVRGHDDGYIVTAYHDAYIGHWEGDLWMLKVNETGGVVWSELLGMPDRDERAWSVAATPDGGYVIGGAYAGTNNHWVPLLTWTDAGGSQTGTHQYEAVAHSGVRSVHTVSSGVAMVVNRGDHANTAPCQLIGGTTDGTVVWTNEFTGSHAFVAPHVLARPQPFGGCVAVGQRSQNAAMRVLDDTGEVVGSGSWSGLDVGGSENGYDSAHHVVETIDGNYLVVGTLQVIPPGASGWYTEQLALIKTDANGDTQWIETLGRTNRSEYGVAGLALDDGSYVILGKRNVGEYGSPVWLFRLAANRVPVPAVAASPVLALIGQSIPWDGRPSTDVDGTVVGYEWDFGDGATNSGPLVTNVFSESGLYHVILTAVDDDNGEGYETNGVYVLGVHVVNDEGFTVEDSSVTNSPGEDPENYPPEGVPILVDWENARGFRLEADADSSTTRHIQATFSDPIPPGYVLYYSVNGSPWTEIAYTIVNDHTVQVSLVLPYHPMELAFLLAPLYPRPDATGVGMTAPPRIALTFDAHSGLIYRVQKALGLVASDWTNTVFAPGPAGAATQEMLTATGGVETIYLEAGPEHEGYYRPVMELGTE